MKRKVAAQDCTENIHCPIVTLFLLLLCLFEPPHTILFHATVDYHRSHQYRLPTLRGPQPPKIQPPALSDVLKMVTMAEPVVSFYLIHTNAGRSDCPQAKSDTLNRVSLDGTSLKNDAESRSWRVTFDRSSTTQTLTCLVVFGSHPKCTIVLNGSNISPVHCIIYAQLNSGHKMMVIEDRSESGTSFFDGSSARAGIQIRILQDRLYAEDLRTIDVGSYQFRIEIPVLEAEKMELGRWFFEHEPQPASEPMLRAQLKGKRPEFQDLGQVGQGGNGKIYRFVEKRTGLLFAVKKQPEYLNNNAQRESMWMKTLQSVRPLPKLRCFC